MNYKSILAKKLKKYSKGDIIITRHAEEQALFRNIDLCEVRENIITRQDYVLQVSKRQKKREKRNTIVISDTAGHSAKGIFWLLMPNALYAPS